MASIATAHGFSWKALWDLPENTRLRITRKDPYVLFPGDQVFIPDLRTKHEACATDSKHTFVKLGVPEKLEIAFTDDEDRPLVDQPYTLEIDEVLRFDGRTDGSGSISHPIPPNAAKGRIVLGQGEEQREYIINLGHVDPVEEISGIQGRLFNLGYYDGPVDGLMSAQTVTSLLVFQDKYQLEPTGENDARTRAKLKELFGC